MRLLAAAFAAAVLLAAIPAQAKPPGTFQGIVARFPSGDVPDAAALQQAISNPNVSAIVIEKGTQLLSAQLSIFKRNDLTICGATGNASDCVLESSAPTAVLIEQATGTVLRGVTIRTNAVNGTAVRINSVFSSDIESFADDTRIDRCAFEGFIGVQAAVRARNLTMTRSRCTVTQSGGAGVLWEDGVGLFLSRNTFKVTSLGTATAAVFVRGAQQATSEGERARHLFLLNNVVDGDFATGFDLADVTDAVVRGNKVTFPAPQFQSGLTFSGRVGIVVRRAAASALTEDFAITGNTVRRAHYALWLLNTGFGSVTGNSLRDSGSPLTDARFADTGGAIRLNLQSSQCNLFIQKNDLRALKSPAPAPAIVVVPAGNEDACFVDKDGVPVDTKNRVDHGRILFVGAPVQ